MKKLIAITIAVLFTGIISSCKKETATPKTASLHSYFGTERRDLGCAD